MGTGWASRRRPSNVREFQYGTGWWDRVRCWWKSGYTWRDGKCTSTDRYLGETCWDGGRCNNNGVESYSETALSCASYPANQPARCVPSLYPINRNKCTCNWFDWNFLVVCGSNDCNGHACVLTTMDMNKYCDYNTDNNW